MPTSWKYLFDRVYVVSLPSSSERRRYVAEHLKANGVDAFEWHDAFGASDPEVAEIFDKGRVHRYPPCFRCGRSECGRDDCNNVLLPVQVATFVTYLALWRKIANREERALVLEDDVRLHGTWREVLPFLREKVAAGTLPFQAETPCLLRLGWALNEDHDQPGPVRVNTEIRMSNPCFGITSAFADLAVSHFEHIDHTADVYLHRRLPKPGQAFTVFPPIASELSWSVGTVSSLIHPKEIYARQLEARGFVAAAEAERSRIQNHPKHMFHRRFLVTGHPRCGTGYIATLLQQLGFDVGHERGGADGISSWMFAADAERYPYAQDAISVSRRTLHWDLLIFVVRDPETAVRSIMRDNRWAPPSYNFRRQKILEQRGIDLDDYATNLERAVLSLTCWTKMVLEMEPDCWVRVENAHEGLPRFLVARGVMAPETVPQLNTAPVNADKPYRGKRRPLPEIADADWANLSAEAQDDLRWYCDHFGYALPKALQRLGARIAPPSTAALHGLARKFLAPSGWGRSRHEGRPVRADGQPLPWFTYGAIEFLDRVVDGGMRVFEYGAGYSTLWWQRAAVVHSVDHDSAWVKELRPKLSPNVTLQLIEQDAPTDTTAERVFETYRQRQRRTNWAYSSERVVRRGLEDHRFLAYAAAIRDSGIKYDVVIIDGMARRLCVEFAVDCLTDSGFIVFDNANRSDYDAAYDILREAGFFQIPFWGLVPGADFLTCTSIFARSTTFLPDARFRSNSFGLPEY